MRAAEAVKLHKEALKRMLIPLTGAKLLTKSVKLRIKWIPLVTSFRSLSKMEENIGQFTK